MAGTTQKGDKDRDQRKGGNTGGGGDRATAGGRAPAGEGQNKMPDDMGGPGAGNES